ncbi:MAG: 3-phenylpropionic acid transporter [bacterium]|nr:MAG: 3-phenylpropionic acid transporter [bacterium]
MGIFFNFFGYYLKKEMSLSDQRIAIILMIIPLTHILVTFSLGYFTNKLNLEERILKILTFMTFLLSIGYLFTDYVFNDVFLGLIVLTVAFSVFRNPILPLVDSTTLGYVMNKGGDYGKIRLWGSIGFVFGTFIVGFLLSYKDLFPMDTILYVISFFLFLSYLSSLKIPVKVAPKKNIHFREILKSLKSKVLILFLLTSFLHILGMAAYHSFFGLYILDNSNYKTIHLGLFTIPSILSEIVLLHYSSSILKRFSPYHLLSVAFLATIFRWLSLYFFQDIIPIVLSQLIHALSWGLFFVTSIRYIDYHFKDRLRTSGITLFSTLVFGLGNALGYYIAGAISQKYSYNDLFLYCSFLALLTFLISLYLSLTEDVRFRLK